MEWLLDSYSRSDARPIPNNVEKIRLNQLVSKLGFFYEKFRNAIDYNDEHLVRRNALERLLRRQLLFLQDPDPTRVSQALIFEFVRARYLPNDTLPETVITDVATIITKYQTIFGLFAQHRVANQDKLREWMISVAATEVDEFFFPTTKTQAMTHFMYSRMVDTVVITNAAIDDKEKNLQLYIATLKTLLKADATHLRYRLLRLYVNDWGTLTGDRLVDVTSQLATLRQRIDWHLAHPMGFQLTQAVRRQSVFFTILRELIERHGSDHALFTDDNRLAAQTEAICSTNYKRIKGKLVGSIFRVILYILFTKTILAFVFELPFDRLVYGQIHWIPLLINVLFHPFLMFVVAMTISVPGAANTKIIIEELKKIVHGGERKVVVKIKKSLKRGSASYIIFNTLYALMFVISFGIIVRILMSLNFNIMSGLLFVFFLTVVSFFGFRLRNLAKQLSVIPRKDNLANFIVDFFSLPIIRVGRFFSANFARVNIFLYILDFVIETPFKLLVEFLERAMSFVKDKREEIVE